MEIETAEEQSIENSVGVREVEIEEFLPNNVKMDIEIAEEQSVDAETFESPEDPVMEISLPPNYDYDWNENVLKIKGLSNEDDVKVWMEELSKTSYVTWRVMRTFPYKKDRGRLYRFKKVYRCQHNTHPTNNKHIKSSKHTGCPATLTVTICRNEDKDGIIWAHATFEKYHNHPIKDPSSLRYRPISDETKAKMIKLFEKGHTAASAYKAYTSKKNDELGGVDYLASADRSNFPTKKDFHNLWLKHCDKQGKSMPEALKKVQVNAKDYVMCIVTPNKSKNKIKNKSSDCIKNEAIEDSINDVTDCLNDETKDNDEESFLSVPNVIKSLEMMFHKLKEAVINDPKNMVPPAKKLINNFEKCSANPTDLAFAMHTAFSCKHLFTNNVMHEKETPIRRTGVNRRTLTFAGKRKLDSVQPADSTCTKNLKEHDCFESKHRKKAWLHNLVMCVDTSVGNNNTGK